MPGRLNKQNAPCAFPHKGLREGLTESLKLVDDVRSQHPGIVQVSVALVAVGNGATPDTLIGERVIPTEFDPADHVLPHKVAWLQKLHPLQRDQGRQ